VCHFLNCSFLGSKERDIETGLDYFGARYFASVQGRFTSIDPVIFTSARGFDPQSLNLYSYVRNNPLKLTDPHGLDWYEKDEKYYWFDKAPKKNLGYHHLNIWKDGYQITNVQGATGQYATYNGHNLTLYNDPARRLVDNGISHPLVGPSPASNAAAQMISDAVIHAAVHAAAGFVFGTALVQQSDVPRVTLYRGVASDHLIEGTYEQAQLGNAFPRGGHSDPIRHSQGDTRSIFTSWTTDPDIAADFATRRGRVHGVVLMATFPITRITQSGTEIAEREREFLVKGPVTGASVKHIQADR
jgi:RHS repeat-associated protein